MKWIRVVLSGLLIILTSAIVLIWPDPEDRVLPGMTVGQVEVVFGGKCDGIGKSETNKYFTWNLPERDVTVVFEEWEAAPLTTGEVRVDGSSWRRRIRKQVRTIAMAYFDLPPDRSSYPSNHWAGEAE